MKSALLLFFLLFTAVLFFVPPTYAGTCDYPSICNTTWDQSHDSDPTSGQECDIPGITSSTIQYKFGVTSTCPGGAAGSVCIPRCGFFWSGWCCDPKNPHNEATKASLTPQPIPVPCASTSKGACTSVNTALGNLSTNVNQLTSTIFKILLSLSGGIAVLLIIAGGYQMAASQGNPEKVKEARERLTAAIVGLLFIIFSVTILQIIGVDILQLPGFGK